MAHNLFVASNNPLQLPPPNPAQTLSIFRNQQTSAERLQSLPEYARISFEEMRLNDYVHGRCVVSYPPHLKEPALSHGLVVAYISWTQGPIQPARLALAAQAPSYGSDVITFHVGKDKPRDFVIHDSVIISRSDFVRLAISKDWKEAKDRIIPLPDDDPDTFELYQKWLYAGHIYTANPDPEKTAKEYERLVKAYLLGEKLIDTVFKDVIIDCIISKLRSTGVFDPRLTNLVYDNTPLNSALSRLWRDVYVWTGSADWLDESKLGDFVNAEFSVELNRIQMSFRAGEMPGNAQFISNACHYHEHGVETCYRGAIS